ncbi:MAG: hypothetical protein ACPGEC_01075 [Flavobacteriales bacterium]
MKKIQLALSLIFIASTAFAQNIKNLSPKWDFGKTYEYTYHKSEQILMGENDMMFKPNESYGTFKISCQPKGENEYYTVIEFKNDLFPDYMDWCRLNKKDISHFEQLNLEFLYNADTKKYVLLNADQLREQFSSKPGGFLYFAQSDLQAYQEYLSVKQEFIQMINDENADISSLFSEQAEPFFMLINRTLSMNKASKLKDQVESPLDATKTIAQTNVWKVSTSNAKEQTVDLKVSSEQFNGALNTAFAKKMDAYDWSKKVNFKVEEHYIVGLSTVLPQQVIKTHELIEATTKKVVFRKTIELKLKVEKLEDQ